MFYAVRNGQCFTVSALPYRTGFGPTGRETGIGQPDQTEVTISDWRMRAVRVVYLVGTSDRAAIKAAVRGHGYDVA